MKEKGREQFWPKKGNKMFYIYFRWLPGGAGIINYQYKLFLRGSKMAQGRPLVAAGCSAVLKMPSRSTIHTI
jgi:hypothetical protein